MISPEISSKISKPLTQMVSGVCHLVEDVLMIMNIGGLTGWFHAKLISRGNKATLAEWPLQAVGNAYHSVLPAEPFDLDLLIGMQVVRHRSVLPSSGKSAIHGGLLVYPIASGTDRKGWEGVLSMVHFRGNKHITRALILENDLCHARTDRYKVLVSQLSIN